MSHLIFRGSIQIKIKNAKIKKICECKHCTQFVRTRTLTHTHTHLNHSPQSRLYSPLNIHIQLHSYANIFANILANHIFADIFAHISPVEYKQRRSEYEKS